MQLHATREAFQRIQSTLQDQSLRLSRLEANMDDKFARICAMQQELCRNLLTVLPNSQPTEHSEYFAYSQNQPSINDSPTASLSKRRQLFSSQFALSVDNLSSFPHTMQSQQQPSPDNKTIVESIDSNSTLVAVEELDIGAMMIASSLSQAPPVNNHGGKGRGKAKQPSSNWRTFKVIQINHAPFINLQKALQ